MTLFQQEEGQRIAAYLEARGISRYRVGGAAVLFQHNGGTHSVSSVSEATRLLFNLTHASEMDRLRAARA